ncbi:GRAS family transcription factor [Medicago truncatula]|uniref:GRAS family transcription factor n=1 Tax=Medicago truncatula TaxID=3880 RepID=G7IZ35_MEDTR|nr:GRAS family transcription factor [Medicago truncatula]
MECEKVVQIIDLRCAEPDQCINLLQTSKKSQGGPHHRKITGIHEKKDVLDQMSYHLTTKAGKLHFPLQINPTEVLHSLLAADDEMAGRISPAGPAFINLQRAVHIGQRDFVKCLERYMINAYILSCFIQS